MLHEEQGGHHSEHSNRVRTVAIEGFCLVHGLLLEFM
jgi:hypothetical protein